MLRKADETVDTFLDGKLRIIQSRQGYRFSVDALFLAEFVLIKDEDLVIDLGAGSGIISLFLAVKRKVGFIVGIELQKELASQAQRNVALNELERKIAIIQGDLRHLPLYRGFADVVVCNPPYRRQRSGRINPNESKAIARHEIAANLDTILTAAKALLKQGGRLTLIYPANRLTEVFTKMRTERFEPKRLQIIFADLASYAKLALIEGRLQGKSGLKILPPIFGQGRYSVL
ncbi:MAG: methyltransferase [Deltaproteobacteria bacterium]|nr:methyltransferase [Deltaproteobacteria bacterium]MBW2339951.1 methyltransferase [Deltaproteobacteria bacterium]